MAEQQNIAGAAGENVEVIAQQLEEVVLGEDGQPLSKKALKKLEKEREKEKKKQERLAREAEERAARAAADVDYAESNYGKAPTNMSRVKTDKQWTEVRAISEAMVGQVVHVQARVQTSRATGNKMCFLVLREATATVQALVQVNSDTVSKQMVKFASGIPSESIVDITAAVVRPNEPVKSCSVGDVELHVSALFVISE
ncbi:aspartate--tRNA ligase dps1, partial [Coemansia nantahalensis]